MNVIVSAILGILVGMLLTLTLAIKRIADLVWERNDYRKRLIDAKSQIEKRDTLIKEIIKEPVKTNQVKN